MGGLAGARQSAGVHLPAAVAASPAAEGAIAAARWPVPALDRAAAARYVRTRQTAAGGYSFYRTPEWGVEEPNARDTLAALECLRILGLEPPQSQLTAAWLRALQAPDGGYATLTIGWAALRALDVLGAPPERSATVWVEHVTEVLLGRAGPREWRAALAAALRLVELHGLEAIRLGGHQRDAVARLLSCARDSSGGWGAPGADLHTTWVAVRLAVLAGLPSRADAAVAAFVRGCEDAALGLRLAPHAGMTSARALCGGLELIGTLALVPRYPQAIVASVALLQRPDGGLAARHRGLSTLYDTWLGLRAAQLLQPAWEKPA
jgi:hypothetical protein